MLLETILHFTKCSTIVRIAVFGCLSIDEIQKCETKRERADHGTPLISLET